MPAVSIPSNPAILKPDDADFEPDDEWKRQLRKRIEESLESMVKDVKENQAAQLRKQVVTEDTRLRLEEEYKQAMANIKAIASEQYRMELDRERNQRRWTAGKPINPEWTRILAEEQQSIMNTIKQNSNQDDKPTASPTEERRPTLSTSITKPESVSSNESTTLPRTAPPAVPAVPLPTTSDSREERDKPGSIAHEFPPPTRRGSEARGKHPRDRGDRTGSIRRHRGPSHSRSRNQVDDPESPDTADQPEEHRPQARSRTLGPDALVLPENTRWDTSLGRTGSLRSAASFTARSPPKSLPEVWKPTTPLEDDPSSVKSYHLGRRGSSTSIKSTGSGAGVRPTISATIPERVDDADDSGFADRSNYEHERSRNYADKDRRGGRKISRPSPVDATNYADDPPASAQLKSAAGSSVVMQLATSPGPIKSLSSKTSFVNGDERYYRDHSARESPYRESPYSSRDIPPSSRPGLPRLPYSPDDRDHGAPYNHRPPKTPFRDYPHHHTQSPYPLDERRRERDWDIDRERDWDDEREYGRDREYDYRDRDMDRDRDNYSDSRHQYAYPSRSATYPTPPSSVPRPPPHDHVNDAYDDREPPSRNYGFRGHGSTSSPDEWEYQRLESTRPVPTPQPSYSRRDDPDRDQYTRPYPSSSSIPITPRHAPSSEDVNGPSWKEWGIETRRASESRHDGYARSPPSAEPFPRRHPHYYTEEPPRNEGPPVARRKSRPPHLAHSRRRDRGYERDNEGDRSDEESSGQSEDDLEEQTRRLEEERRQSDKRIRDQALEIERLQEEEQRLEDEAKRKEEEVKRKEEEVKRKDQEAKKVEQELQKIEEEARLVEEEHKKKEEARRKEREIKRKEQDVNRKIENANKLVMEAGRKAEEARKKEDEINRKEEQTRRKEEKLKEDAEKTRRMQQEANRIAEQARLKQETLRQMEEETKRKEQEIEERERALKAREEELKRREEEAGRLREEALRLEEEAWRKEEEARRREAEVRRKEQEARKKEEEVRRKEEEARKKEEEAMRKEEATRRREEEAVSRMREERHRWDSDMKRVDTDRFLEEGGLEDVDSKFVEEQARLLQQAQYRKREEEIRRNREERKRQDSIGNDSAWTSSSTSPGVQKTFPQFSNSQTPQYSSPSPAPTTPSAAWTTWGAHSSKPTTLPSPSSARSASTVPLVNRPRNGSISSGSHPTSASPHPATPISENEWARRHAEFTNGQQERFRREQERMEAERQMRAAGKPLSRDEIQRVFEHHDRLWSRLPNISELTWVDFPWPVLRPPSNPDDISFVLVNAYFSAPFLLEKEKAKSLKDRIKEHLRRWHPDRFDSKVLPRVLDPEKEKVKQGAGNVVRYLNDLLRKENETLNLFGE